MTRPSMTGRVSARRWLRAHLAKVSALVFVALCGRFAVGAFAAAATRPRATHQHLGRRRSRSEQRAGSARARGPLSGILTRSHLTEQSAIRVDLSHETVRLPIYRGTAPVRNRHPGEAALAGSQSQPHIRRRRDA